MLNSVIAMAVLVNFVKMKSLCTQRRIQEGAAVAIAERMINGSLGRPRSPAGSRGSSLPLVSGPGGKPARPP